MGDTLVGCLVRIGEAGSTDGVVTSFREAGRLSAQKKRITRAKDRLGLRFRYGRYGLVAKEGDHGFYPFPMWRQAEIQTSSRQFAHLGKVGKQRLCCERRGGYPAPRHGVPPERFHDGEEQETIAPFADQAPQAEGQHGEMSPGYVFAEKVRRRLFLL
jgi:hypothetical protein